MPNRVNHVKIVSPRPAVVDAFLREVCDIPEGWPIGDAARLAPGGTLGEGGVLAQSVIGDRVPKVMDGFITGD